MWKTTNPYVKLLLLIREHERGAQNFTAAMQFGAHLVHIKLNGISKVNNMNHQIGTWNSSIF